jgi:hypothetical protein
MMYRYERETFETDTGCVVEEIRDEQTISQFRDAGLPVITDWEFVGVNGAEGSGPGGFVYESLFRLTLANHDSGSGPTYGFCVHSPSDTSLTYLGNGEYLGRFMTSVGVVELATRSSIGYLSRNGECREFGSILGQALSVEFYEDPLTVLSRVENLEIEDSQATYDELYELWGW